VRVSSLPQLRAALLCLGCAWVAAAGSLTCETPALAQARPHLQAATLERAPGELGRTRSSGSQVIVAGAKGKEILVFDGASGELSTYLETGAAWSKPVQLKDRQGSPYTPVGARFKVSGDRIAVARPEGVDLFQRDTGDYVGGTADLHHAADVEAMPGGDWVINLTWLPIPELVRSAKEKFDGTEPRLVVVDDDLEVSRHGLAE